LNSPKKKLKIIFYHHSLDASLGLACQAATTYLDKDADNRRIARLYFPLMLPG